MGTCHTESFLLIMCHMYVCWMDVFNIIRNRNNDSNLLITMANVDDNRDDNINNKDNSNINNTNILGTS